MYRKHNVSARHSSQRSAFTLVEILVVITVIGILVGMLMVGVIPVMRTAREATVMTELKQLEMEIESFKTQYGFYPPSFVRIKSATDLLPYVNRIAPNHKEGDGSAGSPLGKWWSAVGSKISNDGYTHGDDLVFWLSGLFKNKQYPITGDGTGTPNAHPFSDPAGAPERDIRFDFKTDQLSLEGEVGHYLQPTGQPVSYIYIDHKSYNNGTPFDGYWFAGNVTPQNPQGYLNPKTFQLVTYGLDGKPGNTGDVTAAGADGQDNLSNFAEGRLDKFIINNTD